MSDPRRQFARAQQNMPAAVQPRLGPPQGFGPLWFVAEASIGPQGGPIHKEQCLVYCDPLNGKPIAKPEELPEKLEAELNPKTRFLVGAWPFGMLVAAGWKNVASLAYLKPMVQV